VKIINYIKTILKGNKSKNVANQDKIVPISIVNAHIKNNDSFPFLVSFPRTGSHWLRMMMELYLEKPSMMLLFNTTYQEVLEYTCYHTHDLDLKTERKRVIYLYRNPVDTIFSQLKYHQQNIDDIKQINYWTDLYGQHLDKWLFKETFTEEKIVLTYEHLKSNLLEEFKKLTLFFEVEFDEFTLTSVKEEVTKVKIKSKTAHDNQVINLEMNYDSLRQIFKEKQSDYIFKRLNQINPNLATLYKA